MDPATGVRGDRTVVPATPASAKHYPAALRRVRFFDAERRRFLMFLTDNFDLSALTIAYLYQARWQTELFFKWIKRHLRIKAFYGLGPNAVRSQVWIVISVYVLVAIVRKELGLSANVYRILQVASDTVFD